MNQRAKALVDNFNTLNDKMISVVENCSEEDWQQVTSGEKWKVSIVARHVASGHYRAIDLAKMIAAGQELPELTGDTIEKMNAKHARDHSDCLKEEVLNLLKENSASIINFISELDDVALDRKAYFAVIEGDISTHQFIESIIINNGNEHLANIKSVLGQ